MTLEPGVRLDVYDLVALLGRGGMGEVWLAKERRLERQVALKLLPAELTRDAVRVARFEQEARAASALSHPNVCHIYALGETAGRHYIAMEYVEGQTLRKRLATSRVTIREALEIGIQIASALAAAHAAGVVHRDIKPENVMLRPDGLVKVLDFGLAKLVPAHPLGLDAERTRATVATTPGAVLGTVAYMSPEQARGQEVDAGTDVWALGCVLYELVAGRPPFSGQSSSDVLAAILDRDPLPVAQFEPNAPAELQRIISKALRKDREERWQTVKDPLLDLKMLRRELESTSSQALLTQSNAGVSIPAAATRAASTMLRPADRRTRRLLFLLAIAIASGAAMAWYTLASHPEVRPPMEVVPFTSFPGRELHPTFSPDGNQIAFAWEGDERDNLDIYVKLVGEGRPLRLTTDPRPEFSPAWSPDGRHIAFYRADAAGGEVVLVPALGGPERVLVRSSESWRPAVDHRPAEPVSAGGEQRVLSWFGGGKYLALVGRSSPGAPVAVFRLSLETGELSEMTRPPARAWGDISIAVSPDSQRLAFIRSEVSYWIVPSLWWVSLTKGEGAEPRRVIPGSANIHGFAWEPDNRRLLLSTPEGLRRVTLPTGASELLPMSGYTFAHPAVSASGHRLAFVQASWDLDIWRIAGPESTGAAGGGPRSLIASTRVDTNPAYSPDGRRIAFSSARSGSMQTWVCDADGSNALQLTNFARGTGTPRWSPDGRFLAFDSVEAGTGDIYVVSAEGGPPRRIGLEASHEQRPGWSRDGHWIYFESDRTGTFQLWKMPVAGGSAVQVTTEGGADAFESPDGLSVYYTKDGQQGIWRKPVSGGGETLVAARGLPNLWAIYDNGLCILDGDAEGSPSIDCLTFGSDRWATVARLPEGTRINRSGPSLSASADGRWILYVKRDREESDIMLVENFR
jgi:eukaryotic-like serine/threonine-protein kinase